MKSSIFAKSEWIIEAKAFLKKVSGNYSKQLAIILFRAQHNPSLKSWNSFFKSTSSVHSHNPRLEFKIQLFAPRPNTEAGSFQYRGFLYGTACP